MSNLRDATLAIERGVNDHLGDEITYTFARGAAVTFNAWVEFGGTIFNPGNSSAIADEISVEVPMATVPEPHSDDRIAITVLPDKLWAMKSRVRGTTGATWIIGLKRVTA